MKYVLKSPGMQMPSDFSTFVKNGENKTILLNLIEQLYIEDYEKLQGKIVYFSNAHHCRKKVQMVLIDVMIYLVTMKRQIPNW